MHESLEVGCHLVYRQSVGRQSVTSAARRPKRHRVDDMDDPVFHRDYQNMDDEELGQLQQAYESLRVPLPPGLQSELEIRAAVEWFEEHPEATEAIDSASLDLKAGEDGPETAEQELLPYKIESPPPSKPQLGLNATAKEERARMGTLRNSLQRGWDRLVSQGSLNREQRACVVAVFFLLVLSLLFPPTKIHRAGVRGLYGPSDSVSYEFLFTMSGTVEFTRLFVEWLLTVLVTGGLFVALRKSGESQSKLPTWITPKDDPLAALSGRDQERFEKARPDQGGRAWERKLVISLVVAVAICALGLAYYGSRRIARDLPSTEVSKLAGGASITNYGKFEWNAYNGSDFVLTEVRVSISVLDERGNAVISNRVYRIPAYDFYPQQTKELSADVGFTLGQDQKWGWAIVGAKGRPE